LSNGDASSGRSSGDAYVAAEKISASDQSAGEAIQKSSRLPMMVAAITATAAM